MPGGDETAVASRGDLALHAKWLWDLKDWIDRKWMWQYTSGLPSMETEAALAPPAFTKRGQVALDLLQSAPMRCGGCGAKVGSTSLERALKKLPPALTSQTCNVVLGVDAPDDGAVVEYKGATLVHTVDFFRSFVGDPYVFGQIAANHALSDCDAMGATAATALALVVLPYGGERQALLRRLFLEMDRRGSDA
ncbi:PurM, N-terminal-like protein [Pelagophyceae sp. CCMP2097]|nr:PurM, N-terminal-like protein [Pelagophyceae sp. CCMP2097]